MGTPNSKVTTLIEKKFVSTSEAHLPSTPISTPKPKLIDCDPRSPSANIVRTPIQIASNSDQKDTPIIGVIKSSADDDQVYIDPRSPTVEFTRTPIILEKNILKPRNKNLDFVRQQLTNFSPMKPHGTEINAVRKQGPILLGVSPITKKVNQEKRKSYIGLLETDLDFVETNLDNLKPEISVKEEFEQDNEEQISEAEADEKPDEIPEEDECTEPEEKLLKTDSCELVSNVQEICEMSPQQQNCSTLSEKEALVSPIKQTLEKICQIDKEIKEVIAIAHNPVAFENIDDENLSNAFDKKVTNLIYEDQEISNIPKNVKEQSNGNRTPLSERNSNHSTKKAISKLRVHDKPTKKQDYAVSKIPVFKEKKGKLKLTQQCENTPPKQMTEIKPRKTQWDADKTMII